MWSNMFHVSCPALFPTPAPAVFFPCSMLNGYSTDRSPPGIWFNPDQMLIGLFGCWPSAWAGGQLWQAVLSGAVPSRCAKV